MKKNGYQRLQMNPLQYAQVINQVLVHPFQQLYAHHMHRHDSLLKNVSAAHQPKFQVVGPTDTQPVITHA